MSDSLSVYLQEEGEVRLHEDIEEENANDPNIKNDEIRNSSGKNIENETDDKKETDLSNYIPKGITNIGNTCYLGSFLQLLYHNKAFREDLLQTPLDARHKMKMVEGL